MNLIAKLNIRRISNLLLTFTRYYLGIFFRPKRSRQAWSSLSGHFGCTRQPGNELWIGLWTISPASEDPVPSVKCLWEIKQTVGGEELVIAVPFWTTRFFHLVSTGFLDCRCLLNYFIYFFNGTDNPKKHSWHETRGGTGSLINQLLAATKQLNSNINERARLVEVTLFSMNVSLYTKMVIGWIRLLHHTFFWFCTGYQGL